MINSSDFLISIIFEIISERKESDLDSINRGFILRNHKRPLNTKNFIETNITDTLKSVITVPKIHFATKNKITPFGVKACGE